MIRTETKQYYSGESRIYTFNVPSFSQVKKIYLLNNYIYMVIDYPDEYLDSLKLINLKIQCGPPIDEFGYKYFDTQIVNNVELISSSYGNNIQLYANDISTPYHFFIEVIKSHVELRDTKIDNIIN